MTPPTARDRRPRRRSITWIRRRRALARFWSRYRRSPAGRAGLVIIAVFVVGAVFAPVLASRDQLSESYAANNNQPQMLKPSWLLTQEDREGLDAAQAGISEANQVDYDAIGAFQYPLGTDVDGRSIWAEVVFGARVSLLIGFIATIMTMVIGASIGIAAGYFGGGIDAALSRFIEAFLVLPFIAFAVLLASLFGRSLLIIMVIIAVTSWASTSQLVRAQALSVKSRPYVERARSLGASNWHIMSHHMLPNLFPIIFANTTLMVSVSILSESYLSFLGLGDPNSISWGTILDAAQASGASLLGAWWYVLSPGACITVLALAFAMCGYAIEEILNPRLRRR